MPLAPPSNNWLAAVAAQTNEATVATVAEYATPLFSGRPLPVHEIDRVAMTDGASIRGDGYFKAGERWEADISIPADDVNLGRLLTGLWPTDTASGTAPSKVHAMSGLGSAPRWWTMWSLPGGTLALPESFGKGICSGLSFTMDENGGPLAIGVRAVGQVPAVVSAPTITTTYASTGGWFRGVGAVLKYEEDNATPIVQANIQSFALDVARDVTPMATVDAVNVAYLAQGLVDPSFTMTLVWQDWQAYRATYYGAVAGSAASATMVAGSVELNFVHTVNVTSSFKLVIPKVALIADAPEPNPDASPLLVTINAEILKPASGDHIQPTLVNNITPAYT